MDGYKMQELRRIILAFYKTKGRKHLPWRNLSTPYRVLVSEYMLQQTQVERVVPKFNAFIKRFPSFAALAKAPLADVFSLWQGLGYNRRAKYLRDAARRVVTDHTGHLPNDRAYLESLPGVGPYTAGAVLAFSFGNSEPFIETNIRTAVMYHCFPHAKRISDADILRVLETLKPKRGKESMRWYSALMDYGAHLKASGIKLNNKSAHYSKQKRFKGSKRQLRGALMRSLLVGPSTSRMLQRKVTRPLFEVEEELERLHGEGLLKKRRRTYSLAA